MDQIQGSQLTKLRDRFLVWFDQAASFKSVCKLITGTAVGQLITILTGLAVARLYNSAQYGVSATFITLINMLFPISMLRYDMAVMVADDDDESNNCRALAFNLLLAFCLLSSVALVVLYCYEWPQTIRVLGGYVLIIPPVLCLAGSTVLSGLSLNRFRKYSVLSYSKPVAALVASGFSLAGGYFSGGNPAWLIMGFVSSFAVIWCIYKFNGTELMKAKAAGARRLAEFKFLLHKYRQFPAYNLPMSVADHVSKGLPVLIFTSAFGLSAAGALAFAYSLVRLPCNLISASVEQVFVERAARSKKDLRRLRTLIWKTCLSLSLVSVPPMVLFLFFGEWIFTTAFGESWLLAGSFSRVLIIASCVSLVVAPVFHVPSVLGDQRGQMIFFVTSCGLRVLGTLVGVMTGVPFWGVAFYVAVEVACNLYYLVWLNALIGKNMTNEGSSGDL